MPFSLLAGPMYPCSHDGSSTSWLSLSHSLNTRPYIGIPRVALEASSPSPKYALTTQSLKQQDYEISLNTLPYFGITRRHWVPVPSTCWQPSPEISRTMKLASIHAHALGYPGCLWRNPDPSSKYLLTTQSWEEYEISLNTCPWIGMLWVALEASFQF